MSIRPKKIGAWVCGGCHGQVSGSILMEGKKSVQINVFSG
jgi:hypothetical protein